MKKYILSIIFVVFLLLPGIIMLTSLPDNKNNGEVSEEVQAEDIQSNNFNLEIGVKLIGATTTTYSNQGGEMPPSNRYFYSTFNVQWLDENGSTSLGQGTIEFDTNENDSTVLRANNSDLSPRRNYVVGCQTFNYHYDSWGFLGFGIVRRMAKITLNNQSGWTFSGYELNDGSMVNSSAKEMYIYRLQDDKEYVSTDLPNADKVSRQLYAKVILVYRASYTISYSANGATNVPSYQGALAGVSTNLSSTVPLRDGYKFVAWEYNGTRYNPGQSVTFYAESSLIFNAIWEPIDYTITFNTDGGGSISSLNYNIESSSTLPTPTKKGYEFDGWIPTENSGNWSKSTTYNAGHSVKGQYGNVTLKAQWNPIEYTISYTLNDGDYGTYYPTAGTYDSYVRISNPSKEGYTFAGWTASDLDTSTAKYGSTSSTKENWTNGSTKVTNQYFRNLRSTTGTVTLTAQWNPISYSIDYELNDGTWASDYSPPNNTDYDTEIEISNPTKEGYDFAGWTASGLNTSTAKIGSSSSSVTTSWNGTTKTTNQYFKNLRSTSGTVTLTANWTGYPYTVKFDGNNSTSGSMSDQSFTYGVEQKLSNNTYVRTGYTFIGWSTSSTATEPAYTNGQSVSNLTTTKNGVVTLYAVWQANEYTLTFDANGGSVTPTSIKVIYNSTYGGQNGDALPVPTRAGYVFKGWYTSTTSSTQKTASDKYTTAGDSELHAQWQETWTTTGNYSANLSSDSEGYYLINTPADLARVAYLINDTTRADVISMKFRLTINIDMSAHTWNPIGTQTRAYTGTFDGNGYIIKGITTYYNSKISTVYNYIGLFGYTNGATIKNVYVQGDLSGGNNVGGIIGYANGATTLTNSAFSGSITCPSTNRGALIGGGTNSSKIIDCTVFSATSTNTITIEGGSTSVTSCVYILNGTKGYTGSSFTNYVYVTGMSAPVPKGLSWLAQGGTSATLSTIQNWKNS